MAERGLLDDLTDFLGIFDSKPEQASSPPGVIDTEGETVGAPPIGDCCTELTRICMRSGQAYSSPVELRDWLLACRRAWERAQKL